VRVGVFGGTFDPPHLGHLIIAEEAREALGLQRVLFVPARLPPHKAPVGPAAARLELCRAAVAGHPAFEACDLELRRAGPSYTVDTLAALGGEDPATELFCLLGSDSAVELHTWHDPSRLYALATFVALVRPGWPRERIGAWLQGQHPRPRLQVLAVPGIGIASSLVRERVAAGRSIRYLVPEPVRALIEAHGLYREGGGRPAGGL